MGMHNFKDLKIWLRSMDFVEKVYGASGNFPMEERYGLTSQLRRSVISVPSNISEGAGRGSNKQFRKFLEYSMGSINEAQTQIELAFRVKYLQEQIYRVLVDEALQIYKMILAFYKSLNDDE